MGIRIQNKLTASITQVVSVLLVCLIAGSSITLGQAASPSPSVEPGNEDKQTTQKSAPASNDKDQTNAQSGQQDVDNQPPKKEKRGSFVIAPIPISSPAFGSGLLLILGYVFQFDKEDKVSSPSWLGGAGAFTSNGTRGLALGGRLYLKENKYQTTFAYVRGKVKLDFFGIGRIPGRAAISVPLRINGTAYFGEGMRNIGDNIFVGARFQYRNLAIGIDGPPVEGGFELPQIDIKSVSAALGFHIQRDKRDSTFYPTRGSLFDFTGDFFDHAFGSRREYQTYKIAYNGFRELKPRHVLAYRAMACAANGSVPFYDLCFYGYSNDVRGYTTGEFQNRRMFAGQAEYRLDWRKRLGFVAFGGVGGVARDWKSFRSDGLLPGAGFGVRFKLDKKNHINYRIDVGFGRSGRTLTIGVGEAF
jgi:hypothetical protein